jgi:SAM-dependent methyltransferase
MRYHDILGNLRAAYDGGAEERDRRKKQPWKVAERAGFLERLAQGARLLEVGAGTGQDSLFFIAHGLEVVATDLSPVMVERCRATAGPRLSQGVPSPTAPVMSALSAPRSALTDWPCGVSRAAVRMYSRALPCSRTW